MDEVMSVSEARSRLTGLVRDMQRADADAVVIGAHRKPQAVLIPYGGRPGVAGVSLERLRELRGPIARLAEASHLSDVRVYGSVARGTQTAASDVDLLVSPTERATLFDLGQFEMDLEAILGVPVSVVSTGALDAARDAGILAAAVPL